MRIRARVSLAVGVTAVLLPLGAVAFAPRALGRSAAALFPGCLYDVPVPVAQRPALVALTIDDAPDTTTPAILDTLRAHRARATFFVISGQLVGNAATVERIRREGHEVGNHFTRDRPAIRLDSAAFERDLAAADSALRPFGPLAWARPGSGWYSPRMVRTMTRAGYRCALGSVYPLDAALGWPAISAWHIVSHARPGAVIVLHDRGARGRRTAAVLGRVLPTLRARGYQLVTLSELARASR